MMIKRLDKRLIAELEVTQCIQREFEVDLVSIDTEDDPIKVTFFHRGMDPDDEMAYMSVFVTDDIYQAEDVLSVLYNTMHWMKYKDNPDAKA